MLKSSDRSSQQESYFNLLQHWISKYSLAIWGSMCAVAISISTLSALDLLSAGPTELDTPQPKPTETSAVPVESPPAETPALTAPKFPAFGEGFPLPVVVLLLVACGTGTLAATYFFKWLSTFDEPSRRSKPKRKRRKIRPSAKVQSSSIRPSARDATPFSVRPGRETSMPPQRSTPPRTPPVPVSLAVSAPELAASEIPFQPDSAAVTVVPPEEVVSLDRRKLSLADRMDLRKRHTLTSLVRSEKA